MAGLTVAHRVALSAVFERASDSMLNALSAASGVLHGVRADELRVMLHTEILERRRRQAVLGPILPMFKPRADGVEAVTFPPSVVKRLWETASAREPDILFQLDADEPAKVSAVADRICLSAAMAVRDRPHSIWPEDEAPDRRQAGLDALAASLDLTPVLRRRLPSLDAWVKRPDEDQLADLRLLLRDCTAIHSDGAYRAMDAVFAHLEDAVLVLRIIALSAGGAGRETFVAGSEMAVFVDRIVAATRVRVARIVAFKPAQGTGGVDAVIEDLKWCAASLTELDVTLDLSAHGRWGKATKECRVALDTHMGGVMRAAGRALAKALPMEKVAVTGSVKRNAPQLTAPADGPNIDAARDLLRLVGALRGPAAVFGVEADRNTLVDELTDRLSDWSDEAMTEINDGEVPDPVHALKLVTFAADGLADIGMKDSARALRRRVAVVRMRKPKAGASSRAA
ncbi:MAG: hypothetical protein EON89_07395 [Brevundimonas sp.]|nr:MAG: hypothetical protein EON89_07395 [Brevundimonas sp.]